MIRELPGRRIGVVKFDCLTALDREQYRAAGVPVVVGYAGKLCPDHFFVTNVQEAFDWGKRHGFDLLVTESAGLCNRCSPHIRGVPAVCVIDNLSGVNTPRKLEMNPRAALLPINGITGQGAFLLAKLAERGRELDSLSGMQLRFTTPSSVCAYCTGEKRIGMEYQLGMTRAMEFDGDGR